MMVGGDAEPELGVVVGTTTFSTRALERLAVGLARDAGRVSASDVSVRLADDRGALRLAVSMPLAVAAGSRRTIVDDGDAVRRRLIDGMHGLAGRTVAAVDLRYTGVRRIAERRVR